MRSIESVVGTTYADTLAGSAANESLGGGGGYSGDIFPITLVGGSDVIAFHDVWDHLVVSGFGAAYDTPQEIRAVARDWGMNTVRLSLPNPGGVTQTTLDLLGVDVLTCTTADIWVR